MGLPGSNYVSRSKVCFQISSKGNKLKSAFRFSLGVVKLVSFGSFNFIHLIMDDIQE